MDTAILQSDNNNRNSSGVGIATGYELDSQAVGVRVPIYLGVILKTIKLTS
jgi:hypothetical protein